MCAVLQGARPGSLCDQSILAPQQMSDGKQSVFGCAWGTASFSRLGDIHTLQDAWLDRFWRSRAMPFMPECPTA